MNSALIIKLYIAWHKKAPWCTYTFHLCIPLNSLSYVTLFRYADQFQHYIFLGVRCALCAEPGVACARAAPCPETPQHWQCQNPTGTAGRVSPPGKTNLFLILYWRKSVEPINQRNWWHLGRGRRVLPSPWSWPLAHPCSAARSPALKGRADIYCRLEIGPLHYH